MATRFFIVVFFILSLLATLMLYNFKDYPTNQTVVFTPKEPESSAEVVHHEGEEATEKKEEVKKVEIVLTEEQKLGKEAYEKKGKCVTCHGSNGEGKKSQLAPRLTGQHDWYLYAQLVNFKNGTRSNPKMLPYLKNLTDKDFKDISNYLSALK